MKFGIWTPLPHTIRAEPAMDAALLQFKTHQVTEGPDRAYAFAVDVVRQAEAYGFDITLIAERFLGPDLEAWTLATALATATTTMEMMVAVHPGIVTPQVVAKMGASLDRISGGRFAINIVNGWWKQEFDLFSNGGWISDPDRRYPRLREFIEVIKGLWTEPAFTFKGEFYQANLPEALKGEVTKVVAPKLGELPTRARRLPHPPIYAASRSPIGKAIIAQSCDVWFVEYKPGYRNFEDNFARIANDVREMNELCARYGRSISFGINPQVICTETMKEAEAQADALEDPNNKDRISNALGAGLVGTPELIAERIRRYEDIGVECLMLRFSPMLEGVVTFGREVIPRLRAREVDCGVAPAVRRAH
jgi:FMNH2-dependent dimethyl sulfone monooxygenase